MFLLASNGLSACELPAHPSATAMPVGITTKDGTTMSIKEAQNKGLVTLIQGNNDGQFHYLIPEGSKVELKIVWDPVCHNNPADPESASFKRKVEEYEYIIDGHNEGGRIYPDEEIGTVGGYGFFPLSAMSKFFTLNGNRKDVKEAFTREKGIKNQEEVIEAGLGGPQLKLGMFAATGEKLEVSIVKGQDSSYKDTPRIEATYKSEMMELEGINRMLPGEHQCDPISGAYVYDATSKKAKSETGFRALKVDGSEDDLIVYTKSGLLMKDIDYGLEEPDPKKYIAYIVENDNKEKIHVSGINYDKENPDPNANGGSDGKFNVTFTTPSIAGCLSDGTEADAAIKIMVNSPPAGYKLSNIFWVWEEQTYKRMKSGEVEVEGLGKIKLEDDDNKNVCVYEKSGNNNKCSCGLVIVIDKPQDGVGYAAYKVYDNCGPISTTMKLTEKDTFAEEDGKTDKTSLSSTFKYEINILDSNPFIDKNIVARKNGNTVIEKTPSGDISQNTDKMEVTFYYNYPIYNYEPMTINSIEDLNKCGLVDLAQGNESGHNPNFKSYNHSLSWYWKKAVDVKVDPVKILKKITGDDGRLIGSISSFSGSFTIDNPKPWHVSDKYPELEAGTEINKNLSVFAVLKDPAGNTHIIDVYKNDKTGTPLESANPKSFYKESYAVNPIESAATELKGNSDKNSGLSPYWVDDLVVQGKNFDSNWDTSAWQPLNYLKSDDKTSPEIQVIVLDTRTNRYHIFGTKENVAAGLNNFASTAHNDYSSLINVPYIGRNTDISKTYSYTGFVDVSKLYDTYLKGENAVSTINDALNRNGFVCQKGTRLIFYAHAFDNVAYNSPEKFCGLQPSTFKYTFTDNNGKEIVKDESGEKPFEYVFRQENFDKNGALKTGDSPYKLLIQADDISGNHREFELDIAVLGRTLDIRTLEEKRERIE